MRWLPVVVFCLACNGSDKVTDTGDADTDTDTDADTDTDTDADVPCLATVTSLTPADGAADVATNTEVTATFSEAVTDDQVSLSIDGVSGSMTLASDGLSATFAPNASLSDDTEYTALAGVCDSSLESTFTTGASLDPTSLTGRTYGIRWESLVFNEPDPFVVAFIDPGIVHILVAIQSYDAAQNELVAAAATDSLDGAGNLIIDCASALTNVDADFAANPSFQVGPEDFLIENDPLDPSDDLTIDNLLLTGTFSADGSEILNPHVSGAIDVRPFGLGSCGDFGALVNCLACDDGAFECAEVDAGAASADDLTASLDVISTCNL